MPIIQKQYKCCLCGCTHDTHEQACKCEIMCVEAGKVLSCSTLNTEGAPSWIVVEIGKHTATYAKV